MENFLLKYKVKLSEGVTTVAEIYFKTSKLTVQTLLERMTNDYIIYVWRSSRAGGN